jgi:hypothetical protein
MKRITLNIPDSILKIVKEEAKRKNIPYSQLIRAAIWEQLKNEKLIGQDLLDDLTVQAQCFVKK